MAGPLALSRAVRTARRLAPVAIELYRRWERLPPERKEHYRRMARREADRGRRVARDAWDRRPERLRRRHG